MGSGSYMGNGQGLNASNGNRNNADTQQRRVEIA